MCQDKHKRISSIKFSVYVSNFLHPTKLKVKN